MRRTPDGGGCLGTRRTRRPCPRPRAGTQQSARPGTCFGARATKGGGSAAQNEHGQTTPMQEKGYIEMQNEHGQTSLVQEKGYIEIATLLEEAEGRRTVPSSQRRLSLPRLFSGGSTAGPTRGTRSTRTRWGTMFLGVCACMCVLRAGGAECGGKNGVVHMGCAERAGKV